MIGKLRRDAVPPQRQTAGWIALEVGVGPLQYAEVSSQRAGVGVGGHDPQRLERVEDDAPQPQLIGHRDLRIEQAGGFNFTVEQRLQPRTETADVERLDSLEWQV